MLKLLEACARGARAVAVEPSASPRENARALTGLIIHVDAGSSPPRAASKLAERAVSRDHARGDEGRNPMAVVDQLMAAETEAEVKS